MNTLRALKTATALALLAGAFAAHAAAVPNGCERVSGEEGADEQYFGEDSQGMPIYCAAGSAKSGTPIPRGSGGSQAMSASPYGAPTQGYNDAASQAGAGYGQGGSAYPQTDYGQGAAGYPPAQTGGWQGSGQQGTGGYGSGSASGGYGGSAGGYGGGAGGYGGAGAGGGIQGGSFKGGAHSQNNGAGAGGRNPYASGNAFVKRPKRCKTNCPPAGAPGDQGGYGQTGGYGDQSGYGQGGGYSDPSYGSGAAAGPSSSQGDEPATSAGAWAGASGNDQNQVPVESPPFGDAGSSNGAGAGAFAGGGQPAVLDPNQLKNPPVDPQQFQTIPKPMPKLPGGLLEPVKQPREPSLVQELPKQPPTGNQPATLIDIKPGAAVGGSAATMGGQPKPSLPGGLLQPVDEPTKPAMVQELPKQPPTGNQPATLIDIKPGVAVGGSAAIEAAKKKKKPPTTAQWPKP